MLYQLSYEDKVDLRTRVERVLVRYEGTVIAG